WAKVPCSPTAPAARHFRADSTDPNTWTTFDRTVDYYHTAGADGIGFALGNGCGFAVVDLDHCCDALTGEVELWAQDIIDGLSSFTEWSPSGTGVHIWVRASLPARGRKK